MGCDIHGVVEVYDNQVEQWIYLAQDRTLYRNYDAFATLAGVRGEGPSPKGVPDDVAQTTDYHIRRWGEDGHSHSWHPLQEFFLIWISHAGEEANAVPGEVLLSLKAGPLSPAAREHLARFLLSTFEVDMAFELTSLSLDVDNLRIVYWFAN